jgi:creatinine amidohydrolase
MSLWLHELPWQRVRDYLAGRDTILIPVGAIEQHGTHLPLLTDSASAIDVCLSAAEQTGVLVCPPLWFGWSTHHMGYAGTITLRAGTFQAALEDIGQSLLVHGFKKLVYVNGNRVANLAPMEIAAVRLRNRFGAYVAVVDTGLVALRKVRDLCESGPGGLDHGGESETSLMLHNHPDLVDLSLAQTTQRPRHPKYNFNHVELNGDLAARDSVTVKPTIAEWTEATAPSGGQGDPAPASAEKGARLHDAIVANTVELLKMVEDLDVALHDVEVPL